MYTCISIRVALGGAWCEWVSAIMPAYMYTMYTGPLHVYVSLQNFDVSLYSGDFVS